MRLPTDTATRAAWLGAFALVAQQVLTRTLRDALFLSHHPVSRLPSVFVAAAFAAVLAVVWLTRAIERQGTRRAMTAAWIASGFVLALLWTWAAFGSSVASFLFYVLVTASYAALASGFWLQVSEAFDPRSARHGVAAITACGAFGGLAAGALGRAAQHAPVLIVGVTLALQAVCALAGRGLVPLAGAATSGPERGEGLRDVFRTAWREPYLRAIALLLVSVSTAATLLDFRFKAEIVQSFAAPERVGAFATFYAAIAGLTFLAQVLLARPLLERGGIGPTIAVLPASVALTGAGALIAPGLGWVSLARGADAVFRGSLFRSAYELLFTPIEARLRRSVKTLLDVGFDRVGDVLGSGLVAAAMLFGAIAAPASLVAAVAIALIALVLALRIPRGYARALERGLERGAVAIADDAPLDATTRRTLALTRSMLAIDLRALDGGAAAPTPGAAAEGDFTERDRRRADAFESGDSMRIRFALAAREPLAGALLARAIPLLGRDDVASDALAALRAACPGATGALVAALLDPATPDAVRRRLPRVLVAGDPARAAAGLLAALGDERFEVRIHAGRALARLRAANHALSLDPARIHAAVVAEARRGRAVWDAARELGDESAGNLAPFGGVARDRTRRGLEHCFTLLSLAMPEAPLRVAWRALQTDDALLRGTALEWLEGALPSAVREALWPHLEAERATRPAARPRAQVLDELLRASPSVELKLSELGLAPPAGGEPGD